MNQSPYLSVILPCRNQADHIGRVLDSYFAPLDAVEGGYELVVVPNACTDRTEDVVAELARRDPRIRSVYNPRGGWGLSVLTGLRAARGEVLCYTNSARTDPKCLPSLLDLLRQRPSALVKICRIKRNAPLREIGSLLYNIEGQLLFGIRSPDVNGTPKLFSRRFFERAAVESEGDLLDLELMAQAGRLGVPVVEVPQAGFHRHGGKSSTTFHSAWQMYSGAWRLRQRMARRKAA